MQEQFYSAWYNLQYAHNPTEKTAALHAFAEIIADHYFWLEYSSDEESNAYETVYLTPTVNQGKKLIAYLAADHSEESPPPEILATKQTEDGQFAIFSGTTLFHLADCHHSAVAIKFSAYDSLNLDKQTVADLALIIFQAEEAFFKNLQQKSKREHHRFYLVIGLFLFASLGLYYKSQFKHEPQNYHQIRWQTVAVEPLGYHFKLQLPDQYQTENWQQDLRNGTVFRLYRSPKAIFRNHVINIIFQPTLTRIARDNDSLMKSFQQSFIEQFRQEMTTLTVTKQAFQQINGERFLIAESSMPNGDKSLLLTSALTIANGGVIMLNVLSHSPDLEEHRFFSQKIINSMQIDHNIAPADMLQHQSQYMLYQSQLAK